MGKKITLRELARAANVSPSTVSRVVAGNPTVDPKIKNRIRAVADKLGIDIEGRRKNKSKVIAFLLANCDVLHNFQARVLLGAEDYCSKQGWELLFMSFKYEATTPQQRLHLPQLFSPRANVRAAILGGTNASNLIEALDRRGVPFALLGNNLLGKWEDNPCDVVYSDDVAGARDATQHLLTKGHKAIIYIGNSELPWFKRCAEGYRQAMTGAGLEPVCMDMRFDSAELGYIATKSMLASKSQATAILAGSDQVAAGVYHALREAKVRVPEDISVIGFNDTQGSMYYPPLTSVQEFPEELGRHLAEFVIQRLTKPSLPPQQLTIPTRLVSRSSVHTLQ